MPYINNETRLKLAKGARPTSPGELNYLITKLCISYLENCNVTYQTLNDIMGALTGAQMEFYRRVCSLYEDDKINLNGDVY